MKMFSYSAWSLAEAFSIWLTAWVDTFIISRFLDAYYLGIYKMPMAIVTTVMAMATSSLHRFLFAALSRVQNDRPSIFKYILYLPTLYGSILSAYRGGIVCIPRFLL